MTDQVVRRNACNTFRYHRLIRGEVRDMPQWFIDTVARLYTLSDHFEIQFKRRFKRHKVPFGYYAVEKGDRAEFLSEAQFKKKYVDSRDMILLQVTREEIENVLKDKNMSEDATVEEARSVLARVADVSLFHRDTVEFYIDEVISERIKDPQST